MAITYTKAAPIKVALPTKGNKAPDTNTPDTNTIKNDNGHDSDLLFDDVAPVVDENTVNTVDDGGENGGKLGGDITFVEGGGEHAPVTANKTAIKKRSVPNARQVEYGGTTYPSLTKCLKALGLCRDRYKYVKRTRPELRTDKAVIGILMHERQKKAHQATSYVVAIRGEVLFFDYLTGACTRVNQMLGLSPAKALTQGKVSKYRYEHNKRPKNATSPITLQEAFTACLTRILIKERILEEADAAIFKARMATVAEDLGDGENLFDVVGEDDGVHDALADLANQYHQLEG